jgi:hypothetical protein
MSVRSDLEENMRTSYGIIREYEQTIQTSDRPEERQRAQREVDRQWAHIERYLAEYKRLVPTPWPDEIAALAAHFGAAPPSAGPGRASTVFDQRGQHVGTQINVAGDYIAGDKGKE